MARKKGTPNKKGHKTGGNRKSFNFKAAIATKSSKQILTRRRRFF